MMSMWGNATKEEVGSVTHLTRKRGELKGRAMYQLKGDCRDTIFHTHPIDLHIIIMPMQHLQTAESAL